MLGHLLWRHNIHLFGQKGGKLKHQFLAIYADEKLKTSPLGKIQDGKSKYDMIFRLYLILCHHLRQHNTIFEEKKINEAKDLHIVSLCYNYILVRKETLLVQLKYITEQLYHYNCTCVITFCVTSTKIAAKNSFYTTWTYRRKSTFQTRAWIRKILWHQFIRCENWN